MSDRAPIGFERFRRRAAALVEDRQQLKALGEAALDRSERRGGVLGEAVEDLRALLRLMNAWVRAEYRDIPRATFVMVVAAILYFVVPLDVVPDFLLGLGYVDDVAVIGWVARQLRRDLEAFREWEAKQDAMETFIGRSPLRDGGAPGADSTGEGEGG